MSSSSVIDFNNSARRALLEAASEGRADTDKLLSSLAAEIAMNLQDFDAILAMHGLTREQWDRIKTLPRFQTLLIEANTQWGSSTSAVLRIQAKMHHMLEDALPDLFKLLVTGNDLTTAKVKLVETLMKGGGIVDSGNRGGGGEGVSITIVADATRAPKAIVIDRNAEDM